MGKNCFIKRDFFYLVNLRTKAFSGDHFPFMLSFEIAPACAYKSPDDAEMLSCRLVAIFGILVAPGQKNNKARPFCGGQDLSLI
ncbi:MAG: hypothetical protein EAY75_02920 [Bacteroidetes bacterium]|nr:MAG: hypothetical protein EAY75_02920 [Bacteroidota bacterium]